MAVELRVLSVPDCPGGRLLEQRLAVVLTGRSDVTVIRKIIIDADQADRWGMRGSPTLLVDGADPFAAADARPGMSCRIYWDIAGRAEGAPSMAELTRILRGQPAGG